MCSVMEEKEMCQCDGGERCVSVRWRRKRCVGVMEEKEMCVSVMEEKEIIV